MTQAGTKIGERAGGRIILLMLVLAVQAIAAAYFLFDVINDFLGLAANGIDLGIVMDGVVAAALIAGFAIGAQYVRTTSAELRLKDRSLAVARGALAEQINVRFGEWGLTSGEAEVALFAMKGCNVAEIAKLRNAATGTVRSQLSQVYAKAGVSSQSMLVSLFIEDLIDIPAND